MDKNTIEDRFKEPVHWQWGEFTNDRGLGLRHGHVRTNGKPEAHIVYSAGLGEAAEKSFELSRTFNQKACNFFTLDRCGQGLSHRYLKNRFKLHAENYDHDVRDLIQYVKDHVPQDGAPIFLMGHSTGGLITLRALHDAPDLFAGAIVTGPLLGFQNPVLKGREKFFAKLPLPKFLKESFAPSGDGKEWRTREARGTTYNYSSDPKRAAVNDYWMINNPDLRAGTMTWNWLREGCRAIVDTLRPAYLDEIKKPVLFFTAGKDHLVNNVNTLPVVDYLEAEHKHYPTGKHELLMETDDIRDDLLERTFDFIRRHSKPSV